MRSDLPNDSLPEKPHLELVTPLDGRTRTSRADVHCHSKYSDRSDEPVLRALAAPESVLEPREIYRLCRSRGMDFVTLADHDRIEGALDIAHLPGTFVSCEATVAFPEDGCRIHCLVLGISEEQHRELQRRRDDVYAFRRYAHREGILCSVAHPFYRVNDLLTVDHLEKLILLFDRFEARNGIHDGGGNRLAERLFSRLTRQQVERMADRQGIDPVGERPWVKALTGGSDDHGGFYVGSTWTEAPPAERVEDYLAHLATGASFPGGEGGSTPRLAQSIYAIADGYTTRQWGRSRDPFRAALGRLGLPAGGRRASWFALPGRLLRRKPPTPEVTIRRADREAAKGIRRFLYHGVRHLRRGDLAGGIESLAHLAPAAAALVPYLFAFNAQHKDASLLEKAREQFDDDDLDAGGERRGGKAWVTDTFGDVNGVARTVETVSRIAAEQGRKLTVIACRQPIEAPGVDLLNFKPLLEFSLPGYKTQQVAIPPAVEIYHEIERRGFDEVLISTPGPLGVVALTAARRLGIPVSGIYHTDFPAYVRHLVGASLEEPAWSVMRWFYAGMERVYVRSHAYREMLLENGFTEDQVRVMPRGVDTVQFRPELRDEGYWTRHGGRGEGVFRFLSVGRVSKEKNLDLMLEAFDDFLATGRDAELAIVGDGPYMDELREKCAGRERVMLTGVLRGDELATAYASGDLLLFPSVTDTLGNAVLEAQASSVPAVVSNEGGPKELVADGVSGLVVDVDEPGALVYAMVKLYED
ncbi:MAG TPA: glycosyltransferase, partial [Thermoanaerobaculia bacterium]|nr:glycosyltransferase [Thermoanaerobaculia bacterium]